MRYVKKFLSDGRELTLRQSTQLPVLYKVYEQQQYICKNNTHTVLDCIVSISQPYIRPIVLGKAVTFVEFGVKLDMSNNATGIYW